MRFATWCESKGHNPWPREGDVVQKIMVRLLQSVLEAAGDPDAPFCNTLATGVPVGVGVTMPRTPLVYEEKTKWAVPEMDENDVAHWKHNYSSAR